LFDWANAAQSGMQAIQAQVPVCQATLQRNDNTPGLEPTVAVIKQALSDLGRLTAQAQEQLRTIVNLQVRAATQDQIAIDTLDRVNKAREYLDARLLERDSLPLWRLHQRRALGDANEFYAAASERGLGALNFELHLWVMQESNTSRVKGEVALGVMELLNQAGVEIPFPQRDLRLRAVDPEAAATLIAPNGLKAESAADADAPNAKFFEKAQRQRAGE
jgi:small-conductance mechanosensitive channel